MKRNAQPWIYSAWSDSLFILAPPFVVILVILLFPSVFHDGANVNTGAWIALVLCIDVAHVYSTFYRTYLDRQSFVKHKGLYLFIPLIVFCAGMIVYAIDGLLFWRVAAYLAVFHFIRQQYGFMKIYSRGEGKTKWKHWIDMITIYSLTLYPILHWHISGGRKFNWFVDGDFFQLHLPILLPVLTGLYLICIAVWIASEIVLYLRDHRLNIPCTILVIGTGLSWYLGIVAFNGDLIFTALNVVSHGIPYMALIWMHGNKKQAKIRSERKMNFQRVIFRPQFIMLFIGLLIVAAFIEEGFWDRLVWNDHGILFSAFTFISKPGDNFLFVIVPLLAVPQLTHYVLDGFIWKINKDKFGWKNVTLGEHDPAS